MKDSSKPRRLEIIISELSEMVGESIRVARKRRGWTQADLAKKLSATARTVHRLEKGDPAVSVGTVLLALELMGLAMPCLESISPEKDVVGIEKERLRLPLRVRKKRGHRLPSMEDL